MNVEKAKRKGGEGADSREEIRTFEVPLGVSMRGFGVGPSETQMTSKLGAKRGYEEVTRKTRIIKGGELD